MLLGAYAFMMVMSFHVKCPFSLLVIVFVLKMTSLDIIIGIQSPYAYCFHDISFLFYFQPVFLYIKSVSLRQI